LATTTEAAPTYGLLVAAALAVIGLGVAASLRGRHRAAPAATGETGPVGNGS
jgi:hypothetical protein